MKCSVLLSFALLGACSARFIFDKRSSCQVGSVGPLNAGNAACSASVSFSYQMCLLSSLVFIHGGIISTRCLTDTNETWNSASLSTGISMEDIAMRTRKLFIPRNPWLSDCSINAAAESVSAISGSAG